MGFIIALFAVIGVLVVVGMLTYWIDRNADSRDSA